MVVVVVVVVGGPYRVFDGGVLLIGFSKSLAGAALSALSATNLPGRPNAFFAANLCLTGSSFELSLIQHKKNGVYRRGPVGPYLQNPRQEETCLWGRSLRTLRQKIQHKKNMTND